MKRTELAAVTIGSIMFLSMSLGTAPAQTSPTPVTETEKGKVAIARIWHGRTKADKANEYYAYLNEAGIKKIQAIPGNLGVQVFRRTTKDVTEFTVISYWSSLDAIHQFAGEDIEKVHSLPRDAEFLLEVEPTVVHHEVVLNEWKR